MLPYSCEMWNSKEKLSPVPTNSQKKYINWEKTVPLPGYNDIVIWKFRMESIARKLIIYCEFWDFHQGCVYVV